MQILGYLLTVFVIDEVYMITNADKKIPLWTAERYAVGSSIQLDQSHKDIILVPDPDSVVCATWRDQFHLRTASQTRDRVHMVVFWTMITSIWGSEKRMNY